MLSKAVLIGVHIALVYALAKVVLFPTDNPQEDWVPSKWGKPWSTGPNSWANIASRRKALLKELDSLSFQPPDSTQLATPPKRLKYPILWAAPFFSRSGEQRPRVSSQRAGTGRWPGPACNTPQRAAHSSAAAALLPV